MMHDLTARVIAAIADTNGPPWFPDLTEALVQAKWEELIRTSGLSAIDYRTSRVLSANSNAHGEVLTNTPLLLDGCETESVIAVELINGDLLRQYESNGVRFYDSEEIARSSVVDYVKDAFRILRLVPSLEGTVARLVRTMHIIKPEDEDYDISFSEPHIPFSIFVSVPTRRVPIDALRVAEAIVHEAMHLQLTLIEQIVPLVETNSKLYFSPWRNEYRTAQGVLHGLYVFCAIKAFLTNLKHTHLHDTDTVKHIDGRLPEIQDQIGDIAPFQYCPDLTEIGAIFTRQLMAGLNHKGAGGIL